LSSIEGPISMPASRPLPDFQRTRALHERRGEPLDNRLLDDDTGGGRAALTGREEGGVDHDVHGVGNLRVGEHDRRVLAAHLELHARPALRGLDRDAAAGGFRSGERDGPHGCVLDDLGADFRAGTSHEVDRAFRDARLVERFHHAQRTERRQVRRLQHDGIAGDQRGRGLPRRNRNREVPRRDQADDAERTPARLDEHAIALRWRVLAAKPRALAAEVPQDVDRAADFAARFRQGLPFLARHLARYLIGARLEQVRRAVEHLAALRSRHRGPRRLCGGRRGDRLARVVAVGLREQPDQLVCVGRVAVLERRARSRAHPLSAYEVPERLRH
jgi:hypothetical protein